MNDSCNFKKDHSHTEPFEHATRKMSLVHHPVLVAIQNNKDIMITLHVKYTVESNRVQPSI